MATKNIANSVDLYAAKPDIRPESLFLPTPPAIDGGFRWNIAICLAWKN